MTNYTPGQLSRKNAEYSRGLYTCIKSLKSAGRLTPIQGRIVQEFSDLLTELNYMLGDIIKNNTNEVTESYETITERRNNLASTIEKALDANQISPDENNLLLHIRKLLKINTELCLLVHQNR